MVKTVLITGFTSGIGKQIALQLAMGDYNIILVGRNKIKIEKAFKEITNLSNNPNIETFEADLSNLGEIKKLAQIIKHKYSRIDVLINNSGVYMDRILLTNEGFETTFATNYLAPFLLTKLLLQPLQSGVPSRVINVCSEAYENANLDLDNLGLQQPYDGGIAYSNSKLALLLFTLELAKKHQREGITVNCFNPGKVQTNLNKNSKSPLNANDLTVEEGAKTGVFLATSSEVQGISGKYFFENQIQEIDKQFLHQKERQKLWQITEEIIKKFE